MIDTQKFREIKNKHAKIDGTEGLLFEKLNIVDSDTGSYAYLNECIADGNSANFKGLKESRESEYIEPGENTYTIDYNSALIAFSENFTIPSTLYAEYWGGGSIIWADDVSSLQEACRTIDNNTLYKDGSVALTGNLNLNGNNINNVVTLNGVNIRTHKHLGSDVDGTAQLGEESIPALPISKITNLQTSLNSKQDKLPAYQSGKYLTNNGSALSWGSPYTRNIGEVVQSILPLNDSKLHLLDGSLLERAQYSELYNYLLNNSSVVNYPSGVKITGDLQNNNGVLSGFSETAYADIPVSFTPGTQDWEVQLKLELSGSTSVLRGSRIITITADGEHDSSYYIYIDSVGSQASYNGLGFYVRFNVFKTDGSLYDNTHYQDTPFPSSNRGDLTQVKWLRYGYLNSTFYIKCSTDGVNFTTVMSDSIPDLTFYSFTKSFVRIGRGLQNTSYLSGTVDLNGCYIKYGEDIIWQGGISFTRAEADFLTEETIWQSTKEYFGVCGKFVLDITNQTIRLPRVNSILQGSISSNHAGDIVEAGLPNITGTFPACVEDQYLPSPTGAFYMNGTAKEASGGGNTGQWLLNFDASRSNEIYGNSTTVQPQTVKVLHYMVVAK